MSEYIEREKLVDAIEGINWYKYNDEGRLTQGGTSHDKMFLPYTAVEGTIKSIPAADVRPVVLCKDCKYWELSKIEPIEPSFHVCTYVCGAIFVRNDDDFCSRGKKREEI